MAGAGKIQQLPRGRHHLTRLEVVTSQRRRMFEAIGQAVAEKGFARANVADVISRAGVSRETFYEHFRDKEDCFLAAFDAGAQRLSRVMATAVEAGSAEPTARFERAVTAYLDLMSREETLAHVFLIGIYGAGPAAVARRFATFARFVEIVAGIFGARSQQERFACEALVAAISSLVTARVGLGRLEELSALRNPILEIAARMIPDDASRARP